MRNFIYLFILVLIFDLNTLKLSAFEDLQVNGFVEYNLGGRIVTNKVKSEDIILDEARLRLELMKNIDIASMTVKADIFNDAYLDKTSIKLREANISLFPSSRWEMKAGRQILTWGAGDMVFVNDLFPKDWNSYFLGRDDEYLKAPITALKTSVFTDKGNIDFIIAPKFTSDLYINGERMSYWSPSANSIIGDEFSDSRPANRFENMEFYFRYFKNINNIELAFYSYKGFMKQPLGFDLTAAAVYFPKLAAHGASLRGQIFGGIGYIEAGYHDSIEDRAGDRRFIENSMIKSLVGFEKELMMNLTAGIQYFSEFMLDYNKYKTSVNKVVKERNHDWITLRLTNLRKQQTLTLSFFGYYSPAEADWFLRPSMKYQMTDQVSVVCGANIFGGNKDYTFFGQLEANTNAYFRLRYAF